jgi:hypothetical protein
MLVAVILVVKGPCSNWKSRGASTSMSPLPCLDHIITSCKKEPEPRKTHDCLTLQKVPASKIDLIFPGPYGIPMAQLFSPKCKLHIGSNGDFTSPKYFHTVRTMSQS